MNSSHESQYMYDVYCNTSKYKYMYGQNAIRNVNILVT